MTDLPIELWTLILQDALCLNQCDDLNDGDSTEKIPTAFVRKEWGQVVQFMLVCKEWEEVMWSFIQDISCGAFTMGDTFFPPSLIIKHFPRLANNLQLLVIQGDDVEEERDEGEEKEEEEGDQDKVKFRNEIFELMGLVKTCRNLRELFLYDIHDKESIISTVISSSALTRSLERLDLNSSRLSDAALEAIGHEFSQPTAALRRLSLLGAKGLTGPALGRSLSLLSNLVELNLSSCEGLSVDSLVTTFGGLSSLTSLDLSFVPAIGNEEAGKALGNAPFRTCLETLHMSFAINEEVVESVLLHFSGLTALTHLNLGNCGVTTAAFRPLASSLTNLKYLVLSDAGFDTAGVAVVASLPQLEHLDLSSSFTDISYDALEKATTLRSLDLRWSGMTDTNIHFISKLTNLTRLAMGQEIRGSGISALAPLVKLKVLDLTGNSVLCDVGVGVIVRTFPRLKKLHLFSCEELTLQGIAQLTELTTLKHLNLYGTQVRGEALYSTLNRMTWLKRLTIQAGSDFPVEPLGPLAAAGCTIE